jgi:hypothetical protein
MISLGPPVYNATCVGVYRSSVGLITMSFRLPVFNLSVNDWFASDSYTTAPEAVFAGNLSLARRTAVFTGAQPLDFLDLLVQWLLLPRGSEVGTLVLSPTDPDVVEVPAGSGKIYLVADGGYVGVGFANEHVAVQLVPLTAWLKTELSGSGVILGTWPDFPSFL